MDNARRFVYIDFKNRTVEKLMLCNLVNEMKNAIFIIMILMLLFSCRDDSTNTPNTPNVPAANQTDYFPLSVGSWWEYDYDYKPFANDDIWWKGKIVWKITDNLEQSDSSIYVIEQLVNGMVIEGNSINSNLDTSWVVDSISTFEFIQHQDGFVEIGRVFILKPVSMTT